MHAHQHRFISSDSALYQGDVLRIGRGVGVNDHLEPTAITAVKVRFKRTRDDAVITPAIGDEIGDRAHFEVVELRKPDQIIATRHAAVVVHDLANHARGD